MTGELPPGDALRAEIELHPRARFATGFATLDDLTTGGLRAGDISVVGALTGQGKTAFVEQMALNISLEHDVLFIPLEMGKGETLERMGAKLARCSIDWLRRTGVDEQTEIEFNRRRLHIIEPLHNATPDLKTLVRWIEAAKCPVVIIDHVRHIDGWLPGGAQGPSGATKMLHHLRNLALRLGIHIVLCQQLNDKIERTGKRPKLSHLQDTSALWQVPALVILLHRPFYGRNAATDTIVEVMVEKNRLGPPAWIHYRWVGETMSFWELTREERLDVACCRVRAKKQRAARGDDDA